MQASSPSAADAPSGNSTRLTSNQTAASKSSKASKPKAASQPKAKEEKSNATPTEAVPEKREDVASVSTAVVDAKALESYKKPIFIAIVTAHYLGNYGYRAGEKDKCSIVGVPLDCVMADDRSRAKSADALWWDGVTGPSHAHANLTELWAAFCS